MAPRPSVARSVPALPAPGGHAGSRGKAWSANGCGGWRAWPTPRRAPEPSLQVPDTW